MKTPTFTLLVLVIFCTLSYGQKRFTISGYVKDQNNGEALIGVTIYIPEISGGTISNAYGFYSVTLPEGTYHIDYHYIGFREEHIIVDLEGDTQLDMEMITAREQLDEVVITNRAIDRNVSSIEMSMAEMDMKTMEKIPAFAGEVDIIKSLQLLPGVSTVGEGAAGFNVRGGSVGQNLVLLDESPVYQSSHLFGFFSVFNPDAVKDIKLYKGGTPSQYGGRISSILDIRMKEGNNKEYDISGGIGTIFSRLAVEGPIIKDKSSFIIAARRSYADILAKAFTDFLNDGAGLYFYDLTAKTNLKINEKNRIYLSGYFGRDVFKFDKVQGFNWGNSTASFRWNHVYGNRLFSNYSLYLSRYDYGFSFGNNEMNRYNWNSRIITYNFKPEYTWFIHASNTLTFGGELVLYQFEPATTENLSDGVSTRVNLEDRKALEAAVYIGYNQQLSERLTVQYGLRYSNFKYMGGSEYTFSDTIPGMKKRLISTSENGDWETIRSYGNPEPRISFRYQVSSTISLKGSYNRMFQYIHLISNTTAATPIDIWQPSTNNIRPQHGDQFALGYFHNLKENQYETSAEIYYRWTKNQVEYIDGADLFLNELIEAQLLSGIGRAYGLELSVRKNAGRFTGWISYTLGKSELKVDGINYGSNRRTREGDWYPARYDQRHNLKVSGFYELKQNILLSANFTYISGTPTTYPTDRITLQDYVIPYISGSERNNFRIPDYHRLDLSVTFSNIWRGKKGRKGEDQLVVSLYNVYARKNPFSIYFSQGTERQAASEPVVTSSTQLSIIGTLIPSISYNFKF